MTSDDTYPAGLAQGQDPLDRGRNAAPRSDAERIAGAWRRLFGEELPDTSKALAEYDGGDSFATLYPNGRVAWMTYMGTAISTVPTEASQ